MLRLVVITLLLTPILASRIAQRSNVVLDDLLEPSRYDPRISPENATDSSVPTIVTTNIYIRSIDYICTKKMEYKVQMTYRQQWFEPRLRFDDNRGKTKYLMLKEDDRIWRPDTFFSNSKTSTQLMTDFGKNVLIRIYPNGQILYSQRISAVLSCPMDLKYYPFDSQICSITIASYGFTTDDLVYLWKTADPVQVTKNIHLGEFTLKKYSTSYCTSRTNTGEYSCMKLDLSFKRNSSKYICQWFVPTAVLTFIAFLSFWMRPKCHRMKMLLITMILFYLHNLYITNKSVDVPYSTSKDRWLHSCLMFIAAAFVEFAIVKLIDSVANRRNSDPELTAHNRLTNYEYGHIQKSPLNGNLQFNPTNVVQSWKESTTGRRIDFASAILFPLIFVIYMITYFVKLSNPHE